MNALSILEHNLCNICCTVCLLVYLFLQLGAAPDAVHMFDTLCTWMFGLLQKGPVWLQVVIHTKQVSHLFTTEINCLESVVAPAQLDCVYIFFYIVFIYLFWEGGRV